MYSIYYSYIHDWQPYNVLYINLFEAYYVFKLYT